MEHGGHAGGETGGAQGLEGVPQGQVATAELGGDERLEREVQPRGVPADDDRAGEEPGEEHRQGQGEAGEEGQGAGEAAPLGPLAGLRHRPAATFAWGTAQRSSPARSKAYPAFPYRWLRCITASASTGASRGPSQRRRGAKPFRGDVSGLARVNSGTTATLPLVPVARALPPAASGSEVRSYRVTPPTG